MKEHLCVTMEDATARRLRRYASRERRPLSQVVEIAVEKLLDEQAPTAADIVTTRGSFHGSFSREDTYGDR